MNVFEQIAQAEHKEALRELHYTWYGNARVRKAIHARWAELEERERIVERLLGERVGG